MSVTVDPLDARPLHPAHAFFLAAAVPPFLGAALSDYTYTASYQVQWINFASWLIVGGLAFGAVAVACALAGLRRAGRRAGRFMLYAVLLSAMWVLGLFNALVHARDAWATMPVGLVLSVVVALLSVAAAWIGFSGLRAGRVP